MLELESDKTESKSTLTLEFFNIRTVLKGLRTEATVRQLTTVNHISIITWKFNRATRTRFYYATYFMLLDGEWFHFHIRVFSYTGVFKIKHFACERDLPL